MLLEFYYDHEITSFFLWMTSRPKNDLLQRKVFLWTFMSPTFFSIIWIIFSNFVEVAVNYELEMSYFYWVTLRLKNDLFQRKVFKKIKLYLHFLSEFFEQFCILCVWSYCFFRHDVTSIFFEWPRGQKMTFYKDKYL